MSILDKASLIQIPSGYKSGKLYSIKPDNGDGDFDFSRSSSATRVNSEGLIETAQIVSETELVTNGDFATDSDWTKGSGWTISGGTASQDNSTPNSGDLTQSNVTTSGKKYKVTFDLVVTSGTISALVGGHNLFTSSGTKTFIKTANSTNLTFRNYSNFIGSIDNVSVKEVIENDIPRLDYSDGSCASLLLEPQSTNLSTNSQPTSGDGFQTGVVFQQTDIYDWDGIYYGDNTVRRIAFFSNTTIVGQTYTFSVFIKLTDGSTPSVGNSATDDFRMWNGAATTNSLTITDLGNGIFRCSVVRTATSTTTNVAIEKQTYNSSKTFEVSGYQLEALSYPTSYIPSNSGSQTTRTADVCNNAGTSATFNDSEGVLFADIAVFTSVGNKSITLSDGGNNNRISIGYNTNNRLDVNVISGGSYQVIFNYNGITNPNSFNKIAFKYKENDFALWVNGVEVLTDTSGITPNGLDILNLCSTNAIADFYYGKTKQLMTFNEALSNEELSDLTGQINTSFVQLANFYNYTIL